MSKLINAVLQHIEESVHPDLREHVIKAMEKIHPIEEQSQWDEAFIAERVDTIVNRFEIVVENDTGGVKPFSFKSAKCPIEAKNEKQAEYLRSYASLAWATFGVGPAGTGKTFLAVAVGLYFLDQGVFDRIVITRPSVEAGEKLGFLPGDMNQKLDPYMRPIYDAIVELGGEDLLKETQAVLKEASTAGLTFSSSKQKLEIAPLAFMRGRTFKNAFIIGDEMQNTTPEQMKMFLTRGGRGCAYAVCGDPDQFDGKQVGSNESGLVHYLKKLENYTPSVPANDKMNYLEKHDLLHDNNEGEITIPVNNSFNVIQFTAKDVERHIGVAALCLMDEADSVKLEKAQFHNDKLRESANKRAKHEATKNKLRSIRDRHGVK